MKLACVQLGCSKNVIDGETILSWLLSNGFTLTEDLSQAEVILVTTCTFIQQATEEAIETITEAGLWKRKGVCKYVLVSGCFAQRYAQSALSQFPEVDLFLDIVEWQKQLSHFFHVEEPNTSCIRQLSPPIATQHLKIADGCNHQCNFCIIPKLRGRYKSRDINDIIQEARWLENHGVKECILVSQDTSFYGRDINTNLVKLLETLLEKTSFHWIRMMYLHPSFVTNDLLKLVASNQRICSYFDIPLQHISDSILSAMNRSTNAKDIYDLIDRIHTLVPHASIRTSFILGFPSETQKQFQELISFVEWARFQKVGVFPYSPEEGTQAALLRPRPKHSTALKRCETLMEHQAFISKSICESQIGSIQEVLLDTISEVGEYTFEGRTQADAPEVDGTVFLVNSTDAQPGDFVSVKIIDADDYDLIGMIQH